MPTPEGQARQEIDRQLAACGWVIQDYAQFNPAAARGIALREVPLKSGRCDYLLLVDRKPLGIIEAKKEGTLLSGVSEQTAHYAVTTPAFFKVERNELPFLYESTGVETFFRNTLDPEPRSRHVFTFHKPETLMEWASQADTLRARLRKLPELLPPPSRGRAGVGGYGAHMRDCQIEAITNLERSFAAAHPRALIQMATGAGKTYAACAFTYRLIKHAGARRVLFLVDRANLGRQAMAEFQQFVTPDTGRKFTELYNVQHLTSNQLDSVARVTICTIQRLYSMLRGEELEEDIDEKSGFELAAADDRPKDVAYNPAIPIETFDFVVTDECHRSIYNLWRQVFLKMADEQSRPPFKKPSPIPKGFGWNVLIKLDGDDLETHYRHTLEELGKRPGMLGVIFRKAQNKIQDPAKLRRLIVDLIDKEQWTSLGSDVKGDAYEGLLQKNAEDVKGGAGQYFTPRALIATVVDVMAPQPNKTICDPACGTGGFLLATHDYLVKHHPLDRGQKKQLRSGTLFGIELVDSVTRLCAMNLLLHGIGDDADTELPVVTKDALAGKHGEYDMVLANPPFGKKSSVTIVNEAGEQQKESLIINRDDFWATTSNKQLNFLQHIFTILKQHGRAAVVLPDNVLFEGGAGETIRRELLKQADVHTLLRLPTGIFYAQGVKANVLFFDRKPAQEKPWTEKLWIYDLRTNRHFTLKENTLKRTDLDDFVACYNPKNRHGRKESERFKAFTYDELIKRDKLNLDIFWLKDEALEDSANLPAPDIIAREIVDDLEAALEQFREIAEDLEEKRGAVEG